MILIFKAYFIRIQYKILSKKYTQLGNLSEFKLNVLYDY